MLELLERQQRLTTNQRKIITTLVLVGILVSFDLLVIGFAAGYMSADRHLSHPQLPRIQLTAGCGGLLGAVVWGWLADRIGRRAVLFGTVLNTALATGMMALTPEGDGFLVVAVCQSLASFGAAGALVPLVCVVQEFVPASKRGWISAMALWLVHLGSTGVVFAGLKLTPIIGWRGMLLTGLVPALSIILIWLWIPESPRWLICRGRLDEARKSIAWALQIEPDWVETPAASAKAPPQAWWRLFRYPRSIAVTCLTSLGQTGTVGSQQWAIFLLVSILNITWGAPQLFYLVMGPGLAGFAGQFVVAYLSDTIGRRGTGMLCGFSAGVALVLAGLFRDMVLGGVSIFWLLVMIQSFFGSGSSVMIQPYAAEPWPKALRASGMGLALGIGYLSMALAPVGLALIAGSSDYLGPKASLEVILPAMLYLAFWYLLVGFAFWLLAPETSGRSIEAIDAALA